jgi:hypothetical protein
MVCVCARRYASQALRVITMCVFTIVAAGLQAIAGQQPGQLPSAPPDDRQTASPPQSSVATSEAAIPPAQKPIDFESHGLNYEALTREGITVMYAHLPPHIKDFDIVQVTVTNGSQVSWTVKPGDFTFVRHDGTTFLSASADEVVESLLERSGRNDVIKLQLLYEDTIYGLANFRSTNGYEQRREAAMAQFVNKGFKAAAAASAITLVATKVKPGDSTDGAVFFANRTKTKGLGSGRFIARTCGQVFVFESYAGPKGR